MAIQHGGFAFPRDEQDNAPSSGDGGVPASFEGRMDTSGGLDTHLSASRGSEQAYRETQAACSGIHDGGAPGLALPTDVERFSTTGQVPADSATTTGGTDRLVVNDMLPSDSNQTAAGLSI
jgi:hypothetical protein